MINYLSSISSKRLKGTAVVRLDFNSEDMWRMKTAIPTLRFLSQEGCKVLVLSHKGRPRGFEANLSLKKSVASLEKIAGRKIGFINHFRFREIKSILEKAVPGSIFVLENVRFLGGESKNSVSLAKRLGSLGDFYVNEGFSISHRKAASVAAITKFLPSYAGFQFEKEVKFLSKVMTSPRHPFIIVLGGGKAGDKLELLRHFRKEADKFLVGGEPANTLLWMKGVDIGDSLAERVNDKAFKSVLKFKNVMLPSDFKIKDNQIFDIGSKTTEGFAEEIHRARTVIWNGPVGLFERRGYEKGSVALARAIIANKKCFSIAGGGETVEFLRKFGFFDKFTFVSTGGGAMLEFLAGKKLPGITALKVSQIKRKL